MRVSSRHHFAPPRLRGAVLLEVVLALVLFVAAAAVIGGALSASLDRVDRLRLNAHAANLAVTVMSELQMGLRSTDAIGPEPFQPPFADWTWELQVEELETNRENQPQWGKVEVAIRRQDADLTYRLTQVLRLQSTNTVSK